MQPSFVSLMYHNVVEEHGRPELAGLSPSITRYFVSRAAFAEHLDVLHREADVLSYERLQDFYSGGSVPTDPAANAPQSGASRPLVQITFDDGWRGCVDAGGPLLMQYRLQALLFVTCSFVGTRGFVSRSDLEDLPRETFVVGSHCVTHRFLNELPDAVVEDELRRSKAELESIVGYDVDTLSIPNGASDARVLRLAHAAGYRYVFLSGVWRNTCSRGPLQIGRISIRAETTASDVARYARGRIGREQLRRGLLGIPKRILGPAGYRRVRGLLLGAEG